MYRCRYAPATVYEAVAGERIDGHHGCIAEQSAELYCVAHLLAYDRYDAHGGGLLVYHADGTLVSYDACDCRGRRVARNGYHVETDGADAGHGLQFLDGQCASLYGVYHALVFADWDEGTRESADV